MDRGRKRKYRTKGRETRRDRGKDHGRRVREKEGPEKRKKARSRFHDEKGREWCRQARREGKGKERKCTLEKGERES